jgi:hypothetical protein
MTQCLTTLLLLDFGLSTSDGGFQSPDSLQQWEYGQATTGPLTGPVWGTQLDGSYFNDADATLQIPLPDLAGATRPVLVVEHWYWLGSGDQAVFEIDPDGTSDWQGLVPVAGDGAYGPNGAFEGIGGGWVTSGLDLSGVDSTARLRLRLSADPSGRAPGWYVREARIEDGDPIPPSVTVLSAPDDTQDLDGPYPVEVAILEDFSLEAAVLDWSAVDAAGALVGEGAVPFVLDGSSGTWRAEIPAQPPSTTVSWSGVATDCGTTIGFGGPDFDVFLAPPIDVEGPATPNLVAPTVTLSWAPPDSTHVPDAYEVETLETGSITGPIVDTFADVPLEPGVEQAFVVRAIYPEGRSRDSEVVVTEVEVPELVSIEPAAAFPGEPRYISIEGRSLYLLDDVGSLVLGAGVRVESFDVRDVNRGVALVTVDADAEPGPRDVVVTGARGTFSFEQAFEVRDSADAPRILSVTPDRVVQGDEIEVLVQASAPFAGPVRVTTDDEILSGGTPTVDPDDPTRITLRLAALGSAREGPHDVILDDGDRLWVFTIDVDEYVIASPRRCQTAPGKGGWALAFGYLVAIARRKRLPRPNGAPARSAKHSTSSNPAS